MVKGNVKQSSNTIQCHVAQCLHLRHNTVQYGTAVHDIFDGDTDDDIMEQGNA